MAQDKLLSVINAKLDALLEKAGIKPDEVTPAPAPNRTQPRKLSEAEQEAVNNAPKAEATVPPAESAPRTTAQNAPSTTSSVPKVTGKK